MYMSQKFTAQQCLEFEHLNITSRDYFTGTGKNLFHDKKRA